MKDNGKEKKQKKQRECYNIYTVSDDGRERIIKYRVLSFSKRQAVGYYVSKKIKRPWEKDCFFAILSDLDDCKNCSKSSTCEIRMRREKELEEKKDDKENPPDPSDPSSSPSPKS